MLETIPFEIQLEIFKWLPAKSIIQFRSLSKSWRSLIDSPRFIASYSAQQQHLVVSNEPSGNSYALIADNDDTFPERSLILNPPRLLNSLNGEYRIIGSSHGVLCLYCDGQSGMALLWNLSVRKAVAVTVPNIVWGYTAVGFGVCRETSDPKIVKITCVSVRALHSESISCIPQVEVFALSTGAWRSSHGNLPRKSIAFDIKQVDVDGFLYWLAFDRITVDGESRFYSLLISFDLTTEEFREVNLPGSLTLAEKNKHVFHVYNLRNSLVVLDHDVHADNPVYVAWIMEDAVSKTFTKLFTLYNTPKAYLMGFRKSGVPVVQSTEDEQRHLVVYEPNSKHSGSLWTDMMLSDSWLTGIMYNTLSVYPYIETLLLLDQPDLAVYNNIAV